MTCPMGKNPVQSNLDNVSNEWGDLPKPSRFREMQLRIHLFLMASFVHKAGPPSETFDEIVLTSCPGEVDRFARDRDANDPGTLGAYAQYLQSRYGGEG